MKKNIERTYEQPNIAWKNGNTTTKIFILGENEFIKTHTSTNYDHTYRGPSIVIESVSVATRNLNEYYVNDAQTWKWISRLLRDGLSEGSEVISPTDK